MSNPEHVDVIYPTRSPPVSPSITPGFNTTFDPTLSSISRANSFARIGSELLPLPPHSLHPSLSVSSFSHSPYPPPTTPPASRSVPQSPNNHNNSNNKHNKVPPPIITSFSASQSPMSTPTSIINSFVSADNNNINNNINNTANNSKMSMELKELSLVRWRTGHAFVIFGALLMVLGFCIGLMHPPVTSCKVPYMAYTYYDNYVPYANMECTTSSNGWYAGAPILSVGALCVAFAWYYSWVKVQEMKMASKYHVAMV